MRVAYDSRFRRKFPEQISIGCQVHQVSLDDGTTVTFPRSGFRKSALQTLKQLSLPGIWAQFTIATHEDHVYPLGR